MQYYFSLETAKIHEITTF